MTTSNLRSTETPPHDAGTHDGGPHDTEEHQLLVAHPAMARSHPLRFLGLTIVLAAGLYGLGAATLGTRPLGLGENVAFWTGLVLTVAALVTFGAWWIATRFHALKVTSQRSIYREGIVSRETSEVQHDDVRNLQVDQGAMERILGVGDLAISSAGQGDMEIVIRKIPHPEQIAALIRERQA